MQYTPCTQSRRGLPWMAQSRHRTLCFFVSFRVRAVHKKSWNKRDSRRANAARMYRCRSRTWATRKGSVSWREDGELRVGGLLRDDPEHLRLGEREGGPARSRRASLQVVQGVLGEEVVGPVAAECHFKIRFVLNSLAVGSVRCRSEPPLLEVQEDSSDATVHAIRVHAAEEGRGVGRAEFAQT